MAGGESELAAVRAAARSWLQENWDPDSSLIEWRTRLFDGGWACPGWPSSIGGRDLPADAVAVVHEELARIGAPGAAEGVGMMLAAPTILEHGSVELQRRLLPATATGELAWCQLFSEPGAGSDLAGLTTRAERDGDEWIVTGQKVWNTGARQADLGLLVARSDWDVPKHQGLTCFALPMHQSGVEVRPLRQMNGHASFNEVFLDEARLPAANVIGDVGGGWRVALTTLAHERRLAHFPRVAPVDPSAGRVLREAAEERAIVAEPHKWYPQRAGRVDLVVERAASSSATRSALIRQEIARLLSTARTARWTADRAAAARALGRPPGPEGSLGKLASSDIARDAAAAHTRVAGADAMLSGPDEPSGGVVAEVLVSVPAISIAGGTDEIQHGIIGERILGLPKEPAVDRDVPFREVRKNRPSLRD